MILKLQISQPPKREASLEELLALGLLFLGLTPKGLISPVI